MPIREEIRAHSPFYLTREKIFEEPAYKNRTAQRAEELFQQRVTVGANIYDAGEKSMDRIDRVLTLANARMNAALAQGLTHAQAFQLVYRDTAVPWKMADNSISVIDAETLMEVQNQAMEGMKALWLKYG